MRHFPRRVLVGATVITAGLLLVSCGSEPSARQTAQPQTSKTSATKPGPPTESDPAPTPATTSSSTGGAGGLAITTAGSDFGRMLFDRRGQAIYLFDRETTSRPQCYGACATAWPPVLTHGPPRATSAVREGLLGTTERADGSSQVTYAGHPLYYYAHEEPHQVFCHNVTEFGGRWLVVTPDGTPAA
ncbi:MAG: COG4315 family predicted lipoprotein [Mycobacteriaceae bacterium]